MRERVVVGTVIHSTTVVSTYVDNWREVAGTTTYSVTAVLSSVVERRLVEKSELLLILLT